MLSHPEFQEWNFEEEELGKFVNIQIQEYFEVYNAIGGRHRAMTHRLIMDHELRF